MVDGQALASQNRSFCKKLRYFANLLQNMRYLQIAGKNTDFANGWKNQRLCKNCYKNNRDFATQKKLQQKRGT